MKSHVAALGLSTAAAAGVLAWRAATSDHRDDRALAAWLHFTNANNLQSMVSKIWTRSSRESYANVNAGGAAGVAVVGNTKTNASGSTDGEGSSPPPRPVNGGGGGGGAGEPHATPASSSSVLPDDFVCPIGAFVMIDPVLCGCTPTCGKSFDRRSIERWVTVGAGTCPHTGR